MAQTRIEFHPAAVDEARAARAWYAERNPRIADVFLAELDAAMDAIAAGPERFPDYAGGTRRYLLRRFPYLVVYRAFESTIQIIAIAHGRRRPGYWRGRVT